MCVGLSMLRFQSFAAIIELLVWRVEGRTLI